MPRDPNRHSLKSHDSEDPLRIVDVIVAVFVLAMLAPLLLLIAAAVAISSPGSPFHRGCRAGKGGANFRLWKFRTMVPDAALIGPPVTGQNDPRITPLGRFLRQTKLDELPQFVNVLFGDMTLVGPRPEAPEIVALYSAHQRAVLAVKPGVTGPVQLSSPDESESMPAGDSARTYYIEHLLERKVQQDLAYLKVRTPMTDARLVLETAALVVRRLIGWPLTAAAARKTTVTARLDEPAAGQVVRR